MPLPPPPAAAFTSTGYPSSVASVCAAPSSVIGSLGAGHHRHARVAHAPTRLGLVAHGADGGGGRADEHEVRPLDRLGEVGALREKPVARVHGVRTAVQGGGNQPIDPEVALRRRGRSDLHHVIGRPHVRRGAVGRGADGHRFQSFFMAGTDDAEGDLSAIGDEHPLHGRQAGGGVSPKRRRRLLQRRRLWAAARSYTPRTSITHGDEL